MRSGRRETHPELGILNDHLNPGDVVEIQGAASSGKTHLLYHLIINCITPHRHQDTILGGWGKAALVFDTDYTFNISRFNRLLLGHLMRLLPSDVAAASLIAQRVQQRLHIFQPMSSTQFATTIYNLAKYHCAHLPDEEIGLLAVDSMSAYYWPDRFTVEQTRTKHTPAEPRKDAPLQLILTALESFRRSHGPVTVMTNWGLHPASTGVPSIYRQHLYPFPAPFSDSHPSIRPDASVPKQFENLLSLTSQITLSTAPPQSHPELSLIPGSSSEVFCRETAEFIGLIRVPKTASTGKMVLRIASDFVSVSDTRLNEVPKNRPV